MIHVKNRKCIRKLSFKSFLASRKRNIISMAAIALTSLLFTSLFTIAMSLNSSYQNYTFRGIGGYAHGTFKDVTEEQTKAIAAHPKVKAVGERKVIGTITDGVFAKLPAEISYMDENCTKWSYAEPTEGHLPEKENEVTMDTGALKLLGIEPVLGAKIPLTYIVGDKSQIAFEKTDTFTLAGWWESDEISPVHYINISEEYAKAVESEGIASGMNPFRTDLNAMMKSSLDIRGQMEQVDLDLGYTWETHNESNSVRIGVNWGYTSAKLGENFDAPTILAVIAFLLLVIFTGYLIIYNIFQISVSGDIRFYGLLKTIGVTPRQLRRIIRQQAMLLCLFGIPFGLLAGYGVGAVLTPVIMERTTTLGASFTTISTSPLIFIISALFALATVLLSCSRPGRIAGKVSPVEATKYTEVLKTGKKRRSTRGAKVSQMAFANLGRNKLKTILVVISLALSVVLLNLLVTFTEGFDMEKYLNQKICADFIFSGTGYFRFDMNPEEYFTPEIIEEIEENTSQTLSGCGYRLSDIRTQAWMSEDAWKEQVRFAYPAELLESSLALKTHRGGLVSEDTLIEGLDTALFEKLTVVEGALAPLFLEDGHYIAVAVREDDYGNIINPETYPAIGDILPVSYIEEARYVDTRTNEEITEDTPEEFVKYEIVKGHDINYTVCAYVTVPSSMSFRYGYLGYDLVLPVEKLENDSGKSALPLFYLFDTPDSAAEAFAERYLAKLTEGDLSPLMYESKAILRENFESFRQMFLIIGGLLCAIIGLVGILNFFNAIMTGILSRKREFAVLQSIGMTNRQLKTMLVYEGLFYAFGAVGTALILSILLNPLVGNLLEDMFWFFNVHFNITSVLIAIPVFTLLGWLIPSVMYGQTSKHSIVERLREAE